MGEKGYCRPRLDDVVRASSRFVYKAYPTAEPSQKSYDVSSTTEATEAFCVVPFFGGAMVLNGPQATAPAIADTPEYDREVLKVAMYFEEPTGFNCDMERYARKVLARHKKDLTIENRL